MNPADWAGLAVAITTLIGALSMGVKHLTKHYLSELKPNSKRNGDTNEYRTKCGQQRHEVEF